MEAYIPAPETDSLYQTAVVWAYKGYDRYNNIVVTAPEEIPVRWVPTRTQVQDPNGNTVTSEVQVVLDRDVPIDSLMWLGTLNQLDPITKTPTSGVMQLKVLASTPDIRAVETMRAGSLTRYTDTMPTVVP